MKLLRILLAMWVSPILVLGAGIVWTGAYFVMKFFLADPLRDLWRWALK